MDGSSSASDSERESYEPRARRDGRRPGIQDDAVGLAGRPDVERAPGDDPNATLSSAHEGRWGSLWQRATATRFRRLAWSAGALVIIGGAAAVAAVSSATERPPDATLQRTAAEADGRILELVRVERPWLEIDGSTLRAYGSFLGLELWSAKNAFGSPCLIAMERSKGVLADLHCAPPSADLFIDVSSEGESFDGHPGDGIVRFFLRDVTVDAYIHFLPEAG